MDFFIWIEMMRDRHRSAFSRNWSWSWSWLDGSIYLFIFLHISLLCVWIYLFLFFSFIFGCEPIEHLFGFVSILVYLFNCEIWTHCSNQSIRNIPNAQSPKFINSICFALVHFVDTQLLKVRPYWNWNQLTPCCAKAIQSSLIVRRLRWAVHQLRGHVKVDAVCRIILE